MNKIRELSMMLVMALMLLIPIAATTGCPQQKGIDKAAKTSLRLSDLTRDAIAATKTAYDNHVIDLPTKDKMAAALDTLIAGGQSFNASVKAVNDAYVASGKTDLNALKLLDTQLTTQVTTPFLAFLTLLGAVNQAQAPYLFAAVNALRAAILLIGSFVSENTVRLINAPGYAQAAYLQDKLRAFGGV